MIIYIASPYTSCADKQAAVNAQIDAFAALRDAGHQPIAPLLSHYVDQRHPANYDRWMQWCLSMVSVADLVVRLPGESVGADAEVAEARRRGIPVVHSVECVVNPGDVYEVTGDAPYKLTTGGMINGEFSAAVGSLVTGCNNFQNSTGTTVHSLAGKNIEPVDEPYTWQDFRREHLAQFEAMVEAVKVEE